jgi:hypothetical protein
MSISSRRYPILDSNARFVALVELGIVHSTSH